MRRFFAWLEQRPNTSFAVILILLFGVIAAASLSRTPETITETASPAPQTSRAFPVKENAFVTATAKVKKSGVIDVVAESSGVVQSIHVRVGQQVGAGTSLVTLTSDYGANAARLSAEKAQLSNEFTQRVYGLEREINERERKIADADDSLSDREEKNAVASLKVELERLKLNRETARLDAAIASASDAVLRPKSLAAGSVEYIAVRVGERVAPGTLIATLRGQASIDTLVADLPDATARYIRTEGTALLQVGSERLPLSGGYLSRGENALGLRSVTFPLPASLAERLTEGEYVTLSLPLMQDQSRIFVPIDAILSGNGGESVLIRGADNLVAKQPVTLGETVGSFVAVNSGLTLESTLLLNRGVTPGEAVEIIQ